MSIFSAEDAWPQRFRCALDDDRLRLGQRWRIGKVRRNRLAVRWSVHRIARGGEQHVRTRLETGNPELAEIVRESALARSSD
jgi:hypothetical protein